MKPASILALIAVLSCIEATHAQEIHGVEQAPATHRTTLYISNRQPLAPSPFVKLPIGSITPQGWVRGMLEIERDGMTGHLEEISAWCKFDGNAWTDPKGKGHSGWEEMPYWLKGYGDLGHVLKDESIIKEARRWIEAALASQEPDGWFGPVSLRTSLNGKPDLWPNMIMLNILQSHYDVTKDPRVLPFMANYFRWELNVPEKDFLAGYWPKIRAGDNLESIYWLYNRTGEKWLLDVAEKVHRNCARWDTGVINWHGVNITQGFREPTIYWMQSANQENLIGAERNYQQVMTTYGQFPGGMFGADENARKGYTDPRQGAETCSMVEFMHSFEMLTKITGRPEWSDRCEDVAFNSLPASSTPDMKGLHYLTCANQVQLDRNNKAPDIQNEGTMFSYSPGAVYRCCQHNVSHGWPYYAEELWLASADGGLCASLYAPSQVTAKVADGTPVQIEEDTQYPFADLITLKINPEKPVKFPLYLRIPAWCRHPEIDGKPVTAAGYLVITREWKPGDILKLRLPMTVSTHAWKANGNCISVNYGPLTFSLDIGEKWQKYGPSQAWPEWEVFPTTPWNYGLMPDAGFEVVKKDGQIAKQPWTPESAPIQIKAKAKRIPGWTADAKGMVGKMALSPVKSDQPAQSITLIPMGAARLRISAFPVIGDGPNAHEWGQ